MKIFKIAVIFTVLILSAPILSAEEQIMPLAIGNIWTYTFSAGEKMTGIYICEITGTEEVSGVEAYKMEFDGTIYPAGYYQLYTIENGEVFFWGDPDNGFLEEPDMIIKNPIEEDFTWTTRGLGAEVEWEIVSLDEELTVPAGTFECIHAVGTGPSGSKTDHWYAPGVGDVKILVRAMDLVIELEKYELK